LTARNRPERTNVSPNTARRLALHVQLLDGRTRLPHDKEGVARTIEQLGYVQIDTIAVIQRAHHHTLWSRCSGYHPDTLHELQAVDRRVFEYWGHAASYLPMSDYRFYLPRMHGFEEPHRKWEKQRIEKYGHLMPAVLERIRKEGPLSSKDFIPPEKKKGTGWWDWRPTKVALELLFWRGELMITERRNFHRIYDLAERVLPPRVDLTVPTDKELGCFLVRRALGAYGIAREQEIREHIHGHDKSVYRQALNDLTESSDLVTVTIGKDMDTDFYALPEALEIAATLKKTSPRLHLLSPFDNLIIQRDRTQRLFGFDYRLECYTPAPKRQYGYFCLPILWGERLVGRLDPKAERKRRTLVIRLLQLEEGFKVTDRFCKALVGKLAELAQFNECDRVELKRCSPAGIKKTIKAQLKKAVS